MQQRAVREARDAEWRDVDRPARTIPDKVGHSLSRRWRHHETVTAEAVGEEEASYGGMLANDRVMVGRHLVQPGPSLDGLQITERGHTPRQKWRVFGFPARPIARQVLALGLIGLRVRDDDPVGVVG